MGNRLKLQNIDFAKVGDDAGHLAKGVVEFARNYKVKFLSVGLLLAVIDDIRVRLGRKKDQKAFEESFIKQQCIIRKHESEINALREDSEQAHEANRRLGQLEQIVENALMEVTTSEQV